MNLKTMSKGKQEFFEKCSGGILNETDFNRLIETGFDVNCVANVEIKDAAMSKEMSALCYAAYEGNFEIVKCLIQNEADVNYRCKRGESALFFAARKGHLKVLQCLLDAGAKSVFIAGDSMDRGLLENWEVFTQVFRDLYPKDITEIDCGNLGAICHALLEHESNALRPNILYEALYCSLTAFRSPVAIYCVGAYSYLCPELSILKFSEENFLGSMCRAFDLSRTKIFINAIHLMLATSNIRSKDVAHNLVKLFNWADLLRMLAEDLSHCHTSHDNEWFTILQSAKKLMAIFSILIANFNVRADFQDQFQVLGSEDFSRIGKLVKVVLDNQSSLHDGNKNRKTDEKYAWQFIFFILKNQIRLQQIGNMNRLLLKQHVNGITANHFSQNNLVTNEFEKRVMLKCLQEDVTLAHMLLDNDVKVTGDCFVVAVQRGHLDFVNRFKEDKDLLFCKEITQLLKIPITAKSSANRNMRRCLKLVKSDRAKTEEDRKKIEAELLEDDFLPVTKNKKKKQKKKRGLPTLAEDGVVEEEIKSEIKNVSEDKNKSAEFNNNVTEDWNGNNILSHTNSNNSETGGKKKKNKKKAAAKRKKKQQAENETKDHEEDSRQENGHVINEVNNNGNHFTNPTSKPINIPTSQFDWKEIAKSTVRRRRQSSSSSDCSSGSRNVHFSHPLNFYENTKTKPPVKLHYPPNNATPGASNLKKTFSLNEAYRTTNEPRFVGLENDNLGFNGFSDINDDFLPWKLSSQRWVARFEDLSELDRDSLRKIHWKDENDEEEQTAYFCDNQHHLNIGAGPDYSNAYLGLTSKGEEVSIKKISTKRAPILSQKQIVTDLLTLPTHVGLNTYHAIVKDKSHCYLVQSVGEYSLEQIYRKKIILNPISDLESCRQIGNAMQFLHKHDILHMAIKPRNVFLSGENQLRLSDYGIHRREVSKHANKHNLSPTISCMCWMARETILSDEKGNTGFTKESDIVSLGMLFFYIATSGGHPFGDPDSIPGVCMNNITRGAYNLKALTDPFAHHLIRNMILKERENRFDINQVVSHPYFWSSKEKTKYVQLLVEKSLNGGKTKEGSILEQLEALEYEILHLYRNEEKVADIPKEYVTDIKSLLTFMQSCSNSNELYEKYVTKNGEGKFQNSYEFLIHCFPSLILSPCKFFNLEDLQNCSADNFAAVNILPDLELAPAGYSVDPGSDIKPDSDPKLDSSLSKAEKLSRQAGRDSKTENAHFPSPPGITPILNGENEVEDQHILLSPLDLDSKLTTSKKDLDHISKAVLKTTKNATYNKKPTRKINIPVPQSKTTSEWYQKPVKIAPERPVNHRESPDDWIEVGSPLGIEVSKSTSSIQCKGDSGDSSSRDASPISGGSVDDCFEFGSFSDPEFSETNVKLKTHEGGSLNNCNINNNNNNYKYVVDSKYTDIDELD